MAGGCLTSRRLESLIRILVIQLPGVLGSRLSLNSVGLALILASSLNECLSQDSPQLRFDDLAFVLEL